ncbi:hypothetical protein [Streptomyces sp. b94]|uniref:hypothetical protein n=1 Tax=Streptomyces sp. b94 TaxID=1827634 RepID=UPI001FFC8919|nr:hypothetical protein [Streptomyces sp. b94]
MLAAGIYVKIVSDTLGPSDTCITRDICQSVPPHVGKNAAEATLQRKTDAEAAEHKAEKAPKKAKRAKKVQAEGKKKDGRKKPKK